MRIYLSFVPIHPIKMMEAAALYHVQLDWQKMTRDSVYLQIHACFLMKSDYNWVMHAMRIRIHVAFHSCVSVDNVLMSVAMWNSWVPIILIIHWMFAVMIANLMMSVVIFVAVSIHRIQSHMVAGGIARIQMVKAMVCSVVMKIQL